MRMAWVDGTEPLLLVNVGGAVRAVPGHLQRRVLRARPGVPDRGQLHLRASLSRFDLVSGEPLDPPADEPLAVYPVSIEDGRIVVAWPT